jgi:hypothetical protein
MRTDDLVEVLSARIDPVDFRAVGRRIAMAIATGSVLAVAAILIGFGPRTGLSTVGAWIFLFLKIAFAAAERCGISESGVKMNIHRGLKALAALIAQETRT